MKSLDEAIAFCYKLIEYILQISAGDTPHIYDKYHISGRVRRQALLGFLYLSAIRVRLRKRALTSSFVK